ncbi:SagB/ThcOx family dehydrogenase [bacterium]|nr:SagB/ThcOx family dehydrogenase [bacterium]
MNKIGREFLEKTQYSYLDATDQMKGVPPPPVELEIDPNQELVNLPRPDLVKLNGTGLKEVIERRRSLREYSEKPLSLEELSFLLWCTQGVQKILPPHSTLRNVPSAGARHAFETYILVNRVKNLEPGLYRFSALRHSLVPISNEPQLAQRITDACLAQKIIQDSAVTFIWVAVPYRMNWRYGERGYRYLFLDAGHVCQNLYLAAEVIKCGVCAIAAFSDADMNGVLELDGKSMFVIYLATAGKK